MQNINRYGLILLLLFSFGIAEAHVNPKAKENKPASNNNSTNNEVNFREDCQPGITPIQQSINNVRATLLSGGDVWWDLNDGQYVVPKPAAGEDPISSIFAGSVWIGGLDENDNLKLAAGPNGNYSGDNGADFYPGPLNDNSGTTDLDTCNNWDRFFVVQGDPIRRAIKLFNASLDPNGPEFECDSIPEDVRFWPGKGNPFWLEKFDFQLPNNLAGLGNFWDEDQDGDYNPCNGDFPLIDIRGCEPANRAEATELVPDEMIFWIYNDMGGPHNVSLGLSIGMEIQVQAFAYKTNDAINDMTFQRYKLINRAIGDIKDCYFSMWIDPDLGCYVDDYIGCDVERSLAYVYNEDPQDGSTGCDCFGVNTYCDEVPILGVDYFRGPLSPRVYCRDANGEVILDSEGDTTLCVPEFGTGFQDTTIEIGMTSFNYINNNINSPPAATTDPDVAEQYYNYLQGLWRDGTPTTFGGSGYNLASTDSVKYVFPDPPNDPNGWSMCTANLPFGDRRTLQTTGPLLLQPDAVNEMIIGVVWVPDIDYPCPDLTRLLAADEKAQNLFDNCFDIIDGPDAPDVCTIELDQEVILVLTNDTITSNNAFEQYSEIDIFAPDFAEDTLYRFEGYKVFQLVDGGVTPQELDNVEKARLVRQVDVQNGIAEIYNWTSVLNPLDESERLWSANVQVEGNDTGLRHSFRITRDEFNDERLINHSKYYFMVLAYGYNNYADFDTETELGQTNAYLEGRQNISTYTVIPRPIVYQNLNSAYGDGPVITRVSGQGVGTNFVDVDPAMYQSMFDGTTDGRVTYQRGEGPIDVIIFNPLEVQNNKFELELVGDFTAGQQCGLNENTLWKLTDVTTGRVINSEVPISVLNEQIISDYGFSIALGQVDDPGANTKESNGALDIEYEYSDPGAAPWYIGVRDGGGNIFGQGAGGAGAFLDFIKTNEGQPDNIYDREGAFANMGDGSWYPFFLTDYLDDATGQPYISPAWSDNNGHAFVRPRTGLDDLNNVDIVMTSDPNLWSRCVVVETNTEDFDFAGFPSEGGSGQFDLRNSPSVGKDGQPDGSGIGMGYFPGYAVDVETGKRLNIFFGENSAYTDALAGMTEDEDVFTGADMLFNPTAQPFANLPGGFSIASFILGGGHTIYVTRQEYDECAEIAEKLAPNQLFTNKFDAMELITWCSMAMSGAEMLPVGEGLVPNDVIVKLRVEKAYNREKVVQFGIGGCNTLDDNPKYEIDFQNVAAQELVQEEYEGALAEVNVVPNPYYAYSAYETSQFVNTVKVTNLPPKANVTIYSIDGKFIRQFKRDEIPSNVPGANPAKSNGQIIPNLEWDMKNFAGIPIASGVYLIHIEAPDLGEERTIKWFGVNRKFDPSGL